MGAVMPHQHFHSKRGFLMVDLSDIDTVFAPRSSFFQLLALNCCLNLHYNEKWLQVSTTPLKSDEFCNVNSVKDDCMYFHPKLHNQHWVCQQPNVANNVFGCVIRLNGDVVWFITFQNPT